MKKQLIELLSEFGYPVFLQGSMNDDAEYPPAFFTFWNFQTQEKYYNNKVIRAEWGFWVYFYSDDPELVDTMIEKAVKMLKENGWITDGKGEDVASDYETHTGRMVTCQYMENYKFS